MKRFALVAAIFLLSAGCHAPMPSWNMLRPANATRVAPPPTGGYGASQPYYTTPAGAVPAGTVPAGVVPPRTVPPIGPTSAPVGTGFRAPTVNKWSNIDDPAIGPIGRENAWEPTRPEQSNAQLVDLRELDVALASHETAAPLPATVVVEHDGPIRILPPQQSRSSSTSTSGLPQLRGMTVNDATRVTEPQPFVPAGRVIDISQLPDAPATARLTNSPTATTASASSQSSSGQATVSDGGWKTRSTTLRVAGN